MTKGKTTNLEEILARLDEIGSEEKLAIQSAKTSEDLENVRRGVFGKKGNLSQLMRTVGSLSSEDRPKVGKASNKIKQKLTLALESRAQKIESEEIEKSIKEETIDVGLAGISPLSGTLHPITKILRELEDIFIAMGFSIALGPDIEDDYHTFEALNFPADHPARDMHDTFYLESNLLLRTHTSPVQIHTMCSQKPPMAVIAPGKCYRVDADVTHSPMFHQIEGFMVDTDIRFSDLKGVLEVFIHRVFGPEMAYRFRPHYFPFTEPSAEVDILFERRHPNGHMVSDWLEILGAGMIHPKVLENCNINSEQFSGFAFGMGIERIAMLKYGINAISHFYDNDVRFLRQFE